MVTDNLQKKKNHNISLLKSKHWMQEGNDSLFSHHGKENTLTKFSPAKVSFKNGCATVSYD